MLKIPEADTGLKEGHREESANFEIKESRNIEELRISVLVSGGGSNLQAVIDGIESGYIEHARVVQVIASKPGVFALERAERHGIKNTVIGSDDFPERQERTHRLIEVLDEAQTDLVVLAGYMSILEEEFIKAYEGKIINIHPSLIPKHCGKGFYGKRVHSAVLAAGDKESGATVHFVDQGVDTGPIIVQKKVPVNKNDTSETLASRVLEVEHQLIQDAVKQCALLFRGVESAEKEAEVLICAKKEAGGN